MKQFYTLILTISISLISYIGSTQNNITVSAADNWVGYMNWFELDGTTFAGGGSWGVPDLKSVVDTGNGTITLQPNFNLYAQDPTDPYWVDQTTGMGAKIMEANTFVEPGASFNNNDLSFSGTIQSFTLDGNYAVKVFIKALDPNNGYADALNGSKTIDLPTSGSFSVSATAAELPTGLIIQYGFTVIGLNANPANEASLGSVVVEAEVITGELVMSVDMTGQTFSNVYVSGTFNGWNESSNILLDDGVAPDQTAGDMIYTTAVTIPTGFVDYKFQTDAWTNQEELVAGVGNPNVIKNGGFTNRFVHNTSESQVLPTVAFNGYIPVGETLVTDIPVLMRVDMSGYSGTVGNVYLSGTLNGWSGDCCQLLDDGTNGDQFAGDGVYSLSILLSEGSYEYKFTMDNWTVQEGFAENDFGTVANDGFVNRFFNLTSDGTRHVVITNESSMMPIAAGVGDNTSWVWNSTSTPATVSSTGDLFFSQYGEGSSNNKFLEIYNGSDVAVDMVKYSLSNCSNGCDEADAFDYPDTVLFPAGSQLNPGEVFVVGHGSADATIQAASDQFFTFLSNGDDAFALTMAGATATTYTIIDILGDLTTTDPGAGWDVAGVTDGTANHTLTRKPDICAANPVPLASFGTTAEDSEWIVGASDSGWDNLGMHEGCVTNPDPILTLTAPSDGQVFDSGTTTVSVSLGVEYFNVANGTGDGHIHYTVNGGSEVMIYDTNGFDLTVADGESYTLVVFLVDNAHTALSPAVSQTVTFSVAEPDPALPIYEGFDYTDGANLGDQTLWTNQFSGDEILVASGNLSYTGMDASTGNHVSFAGAGMDPTLYFQSVTSGDVYASFLFQVTDQSAITDLTDGGYFVVLGGGTSYDVRLWVRPNPDAASGTFDIGFGTSSSSPPVTTTTFNIAETILVVLRYDVTNDQIDLWLNPSYDDLNAVDAPASATISGAGNGASVLNYFMIRQDSTGETPSILFDELRLGTTWESVSAEDLAATEFSLSNFAVYPNPTNGGNITIQSANSGVISVAVYDILGKSVLATEVRNNSMSTEGLNRGVYILQLTQNGMTETKKLIVR